MKSPWRRYLQTDSAIILDIGANDGRTTNEFLDEFPIAKVFAFEPDSRAIAKFRVNVTSPRARLFETAIGAFDGTSEFYVSGGTSWDGRGDWDESGSIRKPKNHCIFWPWVTFDKKTTVPIARLDTWSAFHYPTGPIDLIWADVQGAESDLFQGGRETLARSRFFYTEFSDHEWYEGQPTLRAFLAMIGNWNVLGIFGHNVLLGKL